MELDEEGKRIKKEAEDLGMEEGVIIVPAATKGGGEGPPVTVSRAEAAALKVAALAKEEDEPKLIDTEYAKRASRSGKGSKSGKGGGKAAGKGPKAGSAKPAAAEQPMKKGMPQPKPQPKPKMRLVGGKLVPAAAPSAPPKARRDGPELF